MWGVRGERATSRRPRRAKPSAASPPSPAREGAPLGRRVALDWGDGALFCLPSVHAALAGAAAQLVLPLGSRRSLSAALPPSLARLRTADSARAPDPTASNTNAPVKLYEVKQYKRGIKTCDAVLKKFPAHGETLAMKGLIVSCLGKDRSEEAYKLVREGVKNDIRSYVCWHVYGLLYRAEQNYAEAIKCYRNALRLEKGNAQIMRDLALLQAQCHDWEGFAETRRELLVLKPSGRQNWITFAVATHLAGRHAEALDIVGKYEKTLEQLPPEGEEYEHSELQMYKAMVMEEGGDKEGALKLLAEGEAHIVDRLGLAETRARLLAEMGDTAGAAEAYRALVDRNPDHRGYNEALCEAKGLAGDAAGLQALYAELQERHPKAVAPRRVPLDFLEGAAFEAALERYMRPFLLKGVPSLYSDLSGLQADAEKCAAMTRVIAATVNALRADQRFAGATVEGDQAPGPATLMWALLLQARHLGLGVSPPRFDDALAAIDEAIAHTPTVVDLYVTKADTLAAAGDDAEAARLCDDARVMDLADRYINSKCVMMMMRAGQPELAEERATLFAKDPEGGPHNNLFDMQCMWYELEAAASWEAKCDVGRALKKLLAVEKHFDDIHEDQFDFHSYCIRKMTLRAYVKMLRMEDEVRKFEPFRKAAAAAIKLLVGLHDVPIATQQAAAEEAKYAGMSKEEKKRAKNKARREEQKRKKAEEERRAKERGDEAGGKGRAAEDPDPDGAKLAATETPLEDALRLLKHLEKDSARLPLTHALAHDVQTRRGEALLALQAVKRGVALDAADPDVHVAATRFFVKHGVSGDAGGLSGDAAQTVAAEAPAIVGEAKDALEYARAWAEANGKRSLRHAIAAAMSLSTAGVGAEEAAEAVLCGGFDAPGAASHDDSRAAHAALQRLGADAAAAAWMERCKAAWPHSAFFGGAKHAERKKAAEATAAIGDQNGDGETA